MPKKKVTKKAEVVSPEKVGIVPLAVDTGREDLNQIVAKLNEVIAYVNNS